MSVSTVDRSDLKFIPRTMSESVPRVRDAFLPTTNVECSPKSDCSITEIGSSNGSLPVGAGLSIAIRGSQHTGKLWNDSFTLAVGRRA